MIYAYDQWALMPTRDIYDTLMMAMAINAAKDMYDLRKKDLKDFEDKYADFYSPIQNDMAEYKSMMDNVRNVIDSAYARGVDVLRSPEGSAIIRQALKMVDPNRVNFMKQRAENAAKWYANRDKLRAANAYNEDFINSIGGSPEDWKSDYIGTTEVSPYLDYEKKYGHLFDKMGFEYDPEESAKHPGMLVSTKNKARMHDILSTAKTDLVNDPQYQYDLARMKDSIKETNPNISDEDATKQAIQALDNEIIERNYKGGMLMTEDPIAKEQRAYRNQVNLENLRYKHQKDLLNDKNPERTEKPPLGIKASVTNTGISLLSGTEDKKKQGLLMKHNLRNIYNTAFVRVGARKMGGNAKDGLNVFDASGLVNGKNWTAFKDVIKDYLRFEIAKDDFPQLVAKSPIDDVKAKAGIVQIGSSDLNDVMTENLVITNNYGYYGKNAGKFNGSNLKDYLKNALDAGKKIEAEPTRAGMPVLDSKTGEIYNTYEVLYKIYNDDGSLSSDYEPVPGYFRDPQRSASNDVNVNINPVVNVDVSQKTINATRSSELKSDLKYNASTPYQADYSVPNTWTGFSNPVYNMITNP